MLKFLGFFVSLGCALPTIVWAHPVGYSLTVSTAYAVADPFPDRIDSAFVEPGTGYFQVENSGSTLFTGTIGDIAVSAFAGDLSFRSALLTLAPGQSVSVAIPFNSANVGGFNGEAYLYRSGVEITLDGQVSDASSFDAVSLLVADRDIHSGVWRTDQYTLTSDSFVLQGGDPWGFDTGVAFAASLAPGTYVFAQSAPEPCSLVLLTTAAIGTAAGVGAGQRSRRSGQPPNADNPVCARPRIRAWTSWVPS
jgi:hypothetical protein